LVVNAIDVPVAIWSDLYLGCYVLGNAIVHAMDLLRVVASCDRASWTRWDVDLLK
jgi:hypothetical protein